MSVPHSSTPKIEDIAIPETVEVAIMKWWNSHRCVDVRDVPESEAAEHLWLATESVKVAFLSMAESPIVPNIQTVMKLRSDWDERAQSPFGPAEYAAWCIDWWQRRMFLHKSDPVPEEIKILITNYNLHGEALECVMIALEVGKRIGKESRDAE